MNQRRRTRVVSQKGVTVRWEGGGGAGSIANVSLKGCLVASPAGQPRLGDAVQMVIHLEDGAPELDIALEGEVVRLDGTLFAVDFTEVPPESFHHLFRLVQYNAADPDGIEEELGVSAFGGGPRRVS